MIGFRWAAALLAAAAVTVLLTGCEPLATGVAGGAPTTEATSAAPSTQQTPKAVSHPYAQGRLLRNADGQAETLSADGLAEAGGPR